MDSDHHHSVMIVPRFPADQMTSRSIKKCQCYWRLVPGSPTRDSGPGPNCDSLPARARSAGGRPGGHRGGPSPAKARPWCSAQGMFWTRALGAVKLIPGDGAEGTSMVRRDSEGAITAKQNTRLPLLSEHRDSMKLFCVFSVDSGLSDAGPRRHAGGPGHFK